MNVELECVDGSYADEWDQIVNDSPYGTIFHTWKWLEIAANHSGFVMHPLVGYVKGEPVGLFPLFHRKVYGINFAFSPPPHVALLYLGPVLRFNDNMTKHQKRREDLYLSFFDCVNNYIKQVLKAQYIQIFLPPKLSDPRPFTWSGYSVKPEYNYETDLSSGPETLFQNLPKKKRQNINGAYKRGIIIEMGGKEEIEEIYALMVERYKEQGRRVRVPKEYLLEIYDAYNENIKVFVTKYEDEIVTGVIDIVFKNSLFSWIGNPKPRKIIPSSSNDILQWEEIQYCFRENLSSYVTMGAAGNERLHTYYSSKFNPSLDVRFSAKKCSSCVRVIESAYRGVYTPMMEFIKM